ncbi:SusC/RagA family TonB-linked outer membrane protein [Thalassobellus suaedae]|uniref:TonB-dependent receptor n=1 Tax=Thalassobellus suaedae TaxID=3074124 RepID=A0ABY9XZB2_9FLAO|nr:TonB-dependent receptor [Flavobacteriaceae bacterium HL-DH10]
MKIKLINARFLFRKRLLTMIMKTFIFLLCTTVFSLSADDTFSQEKVIIDQNQLVTVDAVFKIIKEQTNYRFIYPKNLFKDTPKIQLIKGEIKIEKLLDQSLLASNLNFELSKNNTIVISEQDTTQTIEIQQGILISGSIVDSSGIPLPGANILEKGTSNGTQSDFDGNYSLKVTDENSVLVVSYIGYTTREIELNGETTINITLRENASALDEVVVVGYGTQRKSDLTGSVSVVDVDEAKKIVTNDVAKMLQGQVPGVTVQSSGEPGGFVNIKIRGISSFTNNNPLFVVDGMIVDDPYDFATGDIESMQVLKDASASAIYGVRGANGVIIITTKKGKAGKVSINYRSSFGFQSVGKTISVTDRVGYQKITNAAYVNSGQVILPGNDLNSPEFISNVDTDWQDAAYKTGTLENHSISFAGGAETLNYNLNVDYFKNSSYMDVPQDYERYSTTLNLGGQKGKFTYGSKLGYTNSNKGNFNEYNTGESSVIYLLQAIPTMPVYDENRLGGYGGSDNAIQRAITLNVIGYNNLLENTNKRNRFIGNIWGELEILKGLKYKLRVSADVLDFHDRLYVPPSDLGWYYITTNEEASLDVTSGNRTRTIMDNLLTYNLEINKHKFDVLAGSVQEKTTNYRHYSRGVGFDDNAISQLTYAYDSRAEESESTITGKSLLSRLNYSFDDRYLITANYRQDKTSLFDEINNTGDYFSFSGAWKVHNENFINLPDWLNTLKLRAGYGTLGNNTVGPYAYTATVNPFANYVFGNELAPGTTVVSAKDPGLKWEDTETFNTAIEIGMFNNKLQFSAEYYRKTSSDILANVPLPLSSGTIDNWVVAVVKNAADIQNTGFEFALSYNNSDNKFKYNISANLGTLKNEVLKIGENDIPIPGVNSRTEVGRSIGELYAYETDGLFNSPEEVAAHASQSGAQPGDVRFVDQLTVDTPSIDIDGDGFPDIGDGIPDATDGLITDEDRTFQGTTIPKISYGLNFSASYKDFDFSMFWQGNAGNKIYNGTYNALMIGGLLNHHTDMLNYWTPTNTNTNVPRPDQIETNANARGSDRFIESGDYIKLQSLQLGYNVPMGNVKVIEKLRVYLSGQNLLTLSGYKGYDPDFLNDGLFSRGFEFGSFPNPRTFSFGVDVKF